LLKKSINFDFFDWKYKSYHIPISKVGFLPTLSATCPKMNPPKRYPNMGEAPMVA